MTVPVARCRTSGLAADRRHIAGPQLHCTMRRAECVHGLRDSAISRARRG